MSWDADKLRSLFDLLIEKDIAEFEHEDEGAARPHRPRQDRRRDARRVAAAGAAAVAHAHAAPCAAPRLPSSRRPST